jgi:hypothetical protein
VVRALAGNLGRTRAEEPPTSPEHHDLVRRREVRIDYWSAGSTTILWLEREHEFRWQESMRRFDASRCKPVANEVTIEHRPVCNDDSNDGDQDLLH